MARKRKQTAKQAKPKLAAEKSVPNGKTGRVRKKASAAGATKAAGAASALGAKSDLSNSLTDTPAQLSIEPQDQHADFCISCGLPLIFLDEAKLCGRCNSEQTIELASALSGQLNIPNGDERQFIECPGASLYDDKTGLVSEGADFIEHDDGSYEARIVKRPHFPPGHCRRRLVSREKFGKIRRCQACQDYTVRLKRKEGVDFCIPSAKFPRRTKLKSIDIVSHRPPS